MKLSLVSDKAMIKLNWYFFPWGKLRLNLVFSQQCKAEAKEQKSRKETVWHFADIGYFVLNHNKYLEVKFVVLVSSWVGFIIKVLPYYITLSYIYLPAQKEKKKKRNENEKKNGTHVQTEHAYTLKKLAKSTKTSNNPIGCGTSKTAGCTRTKKKKNSD